MLEFRNVSKRFGRVVALEDVSFTINDGEFALLIGPSGAGKTSILRLLIREFTPTEGEIIFDEILVHKLKKREIPYLRQQIGSIFQDFKLLPTLTVAENIQLPLSVKGIPRSEWRERVIHVANLVNIPEKLDLFPAQLSGGELQRATIARALITNPKIIFADEPTGNLDWETAEGIFNLLKKINAEGKTIIVTTHNQEVIKEHKGRIIELKNGKVVHDSITKKKHGDTH